LDFQDLKISKVNLFLYILPNLRYFVITTENRLIETPHINTKHYIPQKQNTFFSSADTTLCRTDHELGPKVILNKLKKTELFQVSFPTTME
jgi:hypothetical protein